jgi:hypothetical protein
VGRIVEARDRKDTDEDGLEGAKYKMYAFGKGSTAFKLVCEHGHHKGMYRMSQVRGRGRGREASQGSCR